MRILVIEEDSDLSAGTACSLRAGGHAVDSSADGLDGLHLARSVDYDAIVLDMMVPKLDGWHVLEQLRAEKPTPVLILSARDTTEDRVRGLDAGADDYMGKPFDNAELQARLRVMFRRRRGDSLNVITLGHVVINTAARTVTSRGLEVLLTAREYAVLECLARRRGEVVSRSLLYSQVCDEDDDTLSNVIDVHIYNLRKKLGAQFITTRRGFGYILG